MKDLLFTALVGFAMVSVTGCTTGSDAGAKCSASGKCASAKKCSASGKCAGDKVKKAVAKKCASGKCGK